MKDWPRCSENSFRMRSQPFLLPFLPQASSSLLNTPTVSGHFLFLTIYFTFSTRSRSMIPLPSVLLASDPVTHFHSHLLQHFPAVISVWPIVASSFRLTASAHGPSSRFTPASRVRLFSPHHYPVMHSNATIRLKFVTIWFLTILPLITLSQIVSDS